MAKASDMYVVNGVIHNKIADIIAKNTLNRVDSSLIICATDEVFEQAMQTVLNHYPHAHAAKGCIQAANAGVKHDAYETDIRISHDGIPSSTIPSAKYTNRFYITTDAVYQANKTDIDDIGFDSMHLITHTGGAR